METISKDIRGNQDDWKPICRRRTAAGNVYDADIVWRHSRIHIHHCCRTTAVALAGIIYPFRLSFPPSPRYFPIRFADFVPFTLPPPPTKHPHSHPRPLSVRDHYTALRHPAIWRTTYSVLIAVSTLRFLFVIFFFISITLGTYIYIVYVSCKSFYSGSSILVVPSTDEWPL